MYQRVSREVGQENSDDASKQRQQQRFSEHLAQQASAARAGHTRTAISCRRDAPRAKSSPAKFAQASSSNSPTVAIRTLRSVESIWLNGVVKPFPAGSIRSFISFTKGPASVGNEDEF